MNAVPMTCPVCLSRDRFPCTGKQFDGQSLFFNCDVCGGFLVSREALDDYPDLEMPELTLMKRAALSHRIRQYTDEDTRPSLWTTSGLKEFCESAAPPPTPGEQAVNIIRHFGNEVMRTGLPVPNPPASFHARIGAPNRHFALRVVNQLADSGMLLIARRDHLGTIGEPDGVDLSLEGWERFEAEKRGQLAGSYGFMALKFDDPELDAFQRDVIKPAVASLGYALEDMRDAARAGLIDNLMRARIRDAAFLLVDLTHGNKGAYWEAGYAEGLGKPVLYLCKQEVFDTDGTHFDTNHCTTVTWDAADPDSFVARLVATLRRSLGLFSS
jgi:hypothetical protein